MRTYRRRVALVVVAAICVASAVFTSAAAAGESSGGGKQKVDPNGELIYAYFLGPRSFDPHTSVISTDIVYQYLLYDRLTAFDKNQKVIPMLAESWKFVDGGTALEMQLRDGVTFHDGSPFNAAAVKANIERAKTVAASRAAADLASVQSVDAVNDRTVRFNLVPGKGAELPAMLAGRAGMMISPKALTDGRDLALAPGNAGSGPYQLSSFTPNVNAVYTPAPVRYWDKAAGRLQRLEIQGITSNAAALNALRAGQVNVAQVRAPDAAQAVDAAKRGEINADLFSIFGGQSLLLRADNEALKDVRVRQAIDYAIDREGIAKGVLSDLCLPTRQFYPSTHWAADPALDKAYPHNPKKAKKLVTQANAQGTKLSIAYPAGAGTAFEPIVQAVQAALNDAGLDVSVTPGAQSEVGIAFIRGTYPALQGGWTAGADPSQLVNDIFLGGQQLTPQAERASVQTIADRAVNPRLSQRERAAEYRKIWKQASDEVWSIPICFTQQALSYDDSVLGTKDVRMLWSGQPDLRNLAVARDR